MDMIDRNAIQPGVDSMRKNGKKSFSLIHLLTLFVFLIALSGTSYAAPKISSVSPRVIQLRTGTPVIIMLKGTGLNAILGVALNKDKGGRQRVSGLTGKFSGTAMAGKLTVTFRGRAPSGNYYIHLTNGRSAIAILPVSVKVSAGSMARRPVQARTSAAGAGRMALAQRQAADVRRKRSRPVSKRRSKVRPSPPALTRIDGIPDAGIKPGEPLTLTLVGRYLNSITTAQIYHNFRPTGTVRLNPINPRNQSQRGLVITVPRNIRDGVLVLKLLAGNSPVALPGNIKLPIARPSITYRWNIPAWGQCSTSCGGGMQTRAVKCRASNGLLGADHLCGGSKPVTSRSCNTQACVTYTWNTTNWSSCSVSCGTGQKTRTVQCKSSHGAAVADSQCSGFKPVNSQTCNSRPCAPPPTIRRVTLSVLTGTGAGAAHNAPPPTIRRVALRALTGTGAGAAQHAPPPTIRRVTLRTLSGTGAGH